MFADVCDSTAIYEEVGDTQALALINGLFARLEKKIKSCGGAVVKRLGDGLVCQFRDPNAAFRAACQLQATAVKGTASAPRKLSIKIGYNYGPVVLKGGDVFGDTVNVCARLVALANPEQVLTTRQSVDALNSGLRVRCRELYPTKVRGRVGEISVCDVLWRTDPDVTETGLAAEMPGRTGQWILTLSYAGETFTVEDGARMGRDKTNEIVVASTLASRVHARILVRDGNYFIVDQSSNGTYLLIDGSTREVRLRREEAVLGERGWIGLGKPASSHGAHVLRYRLKQRAG